MSRSNSKVTVGPFLGGINSYSNQSFALEDDVVDLVNLEVGFDRVIRTRPPIKQIQDSGNSPDISHFDILGIFSFDDGSLYMVGSAPLETTTGSPKGSIYNLSGGGEGQSWSDLASDAAMEGSKVAVQYAGEVWFIPTVKNVTAANKTYYKWSPTLGAPTAGTSGPRGNTAVVYKERVFVARGTALAGVVNGARLFWSEPGDPDNFPAANFLDVSTKDGSNIIALAVYQDSIIIFKETSTWQFSFDIAPSDGTLRSINPVIGTDSYKCAKQYENSIFIMQGNKAYEMVNFQFVNINPRTPFEKGRALPTGGSYANEADEKHISLVGDRLICRYFGNCYVYNLRTRTWSKWEVAEQSVDAFDLTFQQWFGDWWRSPEKDENGFDLYFSTLGISSFNQDNITNIESVFKVKDGYTDADFEQYEAASNSLAKRTDIQCKLKTKKYDFNEPQVEKSMKWWGAYIVSNRDVSTTVLYSTPSDSMTWDQLEAKYNWDQFNGLYYWDFSDSGEAMISDTKLLSMDGFAGFVRFNESVRGSQFQFELDTTTDGSTNFDGGVFQISELVVTIEAGQTAAEKVT